MRRLTLGLLIGGSIVAFGIMMFIIGWSAGTHAAHAAPVPTTAAPAQAPPPLQEVIPLPGPDNRQGQQPGQNCDPVILFYYQGRLFQLQPGPQNRQGPPGSPPEFFPLRPYQGPAIPGLPFQVPPPTRQQGPSFQPVQPRF